MRAASTTGRTLPTRPRSATCGAPVHQRTRTTTPRLVYNYKQCLNCGADGHVYRECPRPHTSFGIILFRRETGAPDGVEYLLICRRHTFGYTECVRAHFDITDRAYTKQLLCEMTADERRKLTTLTFRQLWRDLWQNDRAAATTDRYHHEYRRAKQQFHALMRSEMFARLLATLPASPWTTPEWGFPKGKRNRFETGQACAQRELAEETGIRSKFAYNLLGKRYGFHEPIVEMFQGTDGQRYRHVYYIGEHTALQTATDNAPGIDPTNHLQTREVSAVEWHGYDACLARIRSYNVAKRQLLARLHPLVVAYAQARTPRHPIQATAQTTTTKAV